MHFFPLKLYYFLFLYTKHKNTTKHSVGHLCNHTDLLMKYMSVYTVIQSSISRRFFVGGLVSNYFCLLIDVFLNRYLSCTNKWAAVLPKQTAENEQSTPKMFCIARVASKFHYFDYLYCRFVYCFIFFPVSLFWRIINSPEDTVMSSDILNLLCFVKRLVLWG